MTSGSHYLVAGYKSWNRKSFDEIISKYPGQWFFVASAKELDLSLLRKRDPEYIFFLHWSWRVPPEIVKEFTCVNFHMTDLPYGRGGSPLQNLILRGHKTTKITALQMTEEIDAGPVFLKEDMSLEGSAEEIYTRASHLSAQMIRRIIEQRPKPVPQEGEPTVFRRRRPEQSEIPASAEVGELYDFVRMLDAEGYPRAYLEQGGFRYEFCDAQLQGRQVTARVKMTALKDMPL